MGNGDCFQIEARKMAEMNWRGVGVRGVAILVFLVVVQAAAQPVTVEQLQRELTMLKSAKASDGGTEKEIRSFELTERLTAPTLDRMKEEFRPGRKTSHWEVQDKP